MRRAGFLVVLSLIVSCQRRDDPAGAPAPTATAARSTATASARAPVPQTKDTLTPELKRLLEVLRAGSGHRGETRGTFEDLRRSIGPEAKDWPLREMLKQLEAAGEISIHFLAKDAGESPAYVLSAWRD